MSDEQFRQQIQAIKRQMAVLCSYMMQLSPPQQKQVALVWEEIAAGLGNLQLIYDEMVAQLELACS